MAGSCEGCKYLRDNPEVMSHGQAIHMGPGGCMEFSDDSESDDERKSRDKSPEPRPPKRTTPEQPVITTNILHNVLYTLKEAAAKLKSFISYQEQEPTNSE